MSVHPFHTVRESADRGMHLAVLELDEFTPHYSTGGDHLCFWFALDGCTEVYPSRGAPYCLQPGNAVATIPPGTVWDGSWRGRQTCMMLEVGPSVLREFTRSEIVFPNDRQLTMVSDARIKHGILALHQELLAPSPAGELFVGHIARGITAHYLHSYCARPEPPPAPAGQKLAPTDLKRVQELIEARLDAKPCLEELAAALGLSVASFCRRFKNSTGLPPYQYLLHARVARAKQALLRRNTSLSELALSLGFYDQSQFTNTFRRIVGVSPRDYARARSS